MKLLNILASVLLGSTMAVGVGAGIANIDVKKADATDTYSVCGNFSSSDWIDYDMSDSDDDGIYTVDITLAPNVYKEFKIRKNHDWAAGEWGYSNLLIKDKIGKAAGIGNNNVEIYNVNGIELTIGFRESDKAIFVFPKKDFPESWKKFYLLVNSGEGDDWTVDWSNPKLHFYDFITWETVWDHIPVMHFEDRYYYAEGKWGAVYSLDIPYKTNYVMATKSNSADGETVAHYLNFTDNAAHFYSQDNKDYLYVFSLEFKENAPFLRGDWENGWKESGQLSMSGSQGGPYTISNVNLSGGSAVKALFRDRGHEDWCEFNSVSSNDEERYPVIEKEDSDHNINAGVKSTGTYNITVTYNSTDGGWDYYFEGTENTDLAAATKFANDFVGAMEENCPYTSQDGSSEKVAEAWLSYVYIYYNVGSGAQYYLKDKNSKIKAITDFFSSYDWIYRHYESVRDIEDVEPDFLDRKPSPIEANLAIETINSSGSDSTTIAIVAIIASIVVVSTVGGYFFIRRRRHN